MYCFRNGARYEGEWRKGLKHGFGTFCYPDATKYVGQWRKDNKHGHGIYYYLNGDVYEGAWYKGWRHGLGTYSYIKEKVQHYGKQLIIINRNNKIVFIQVFGRMVAWKAQG